MNDKSLDDIEKYMGLIAPNFDNKESSTKSPTQDTAIDILNENKVLKTEVERLNKKVHEFTKFYDYPLDQLIKKSPEFAKSFEPFMLKYAEELVIQKAFIELAINLGVKLGYKKEDVFKMATEAEINVLDNKHNPSHNTVASNNSIINQRISELKQISYRRLVGLRGK